MSGKNLDEFWKAQKSLTEWLEDIKHKDAALIRREDNDKRERLKILNDVIGLPFDRPVQFDGLDLKNKTPALQKYLQENGDELCALRLMPTEGDLPKLRMRGKSVAEAYDWFLEQDIDASKYRADFVPHSEHPTWATIFVVNKNGVQGEIIRGGHHQLTQGFHEGNTPHIFNFDFKSWMVSPEDKEVLAYLKKLAAYLYIPDKSKQAELKQELGAEFTNDYLEGYFESTDSEAGTWFIDYSQSLGKLYADLMVNQPASDSGAKVSGMSGSPGKAKGVVRIVDPENISDDFPDGGILVCKVTTPNYVPLMQKAAAIVTDQGGILSHAAIVARELGKPCIVGAGNATEILKNGQTVSVDADLGVVFSS